MPAPKRIRSNLRSTEVTTGIVHLGLGAFHRAHQAVYVQKNLERHKGGPWGICAANIRSNRAIVDTLRVQDMRYHVAEFRDREHVSVREIDSIREALFAGQDSAPLLERMASPDCRIVMLTVTEKGYGLSPSENRLLTQDPAIAADIAQPESPRTATGLLVEALHRRRAGGLAPFTVVSCDNMPENGRRTALAVTELARHRSTALAEWIQSHAAFPCTMVDRIVPAMTAQSLQTLETLVGHADAAGICTEAFSQWVVEDNFPLGRPDWEEDGVEMVADAAPYETMKLRMLNGAHSLLAYTGLLQGHETVAEAIADARLLELVRRFFAEARSTLDDAQDLNLDDYERALIERFANDQLEHKLMQIAMDGSQKLPQRWLHGAAIRLARNEEVPVTAIGVAAWMHHVGGRRPNGQAHIVDDPLAGELAAKHTRATDAAGIVDALLGMRSVFPEKLASNAAFAASVLAAFERGSEAAIG